MKFSKDKQSLKDKYRKELLEKLTLQEKMIMSFLKDLKIKFIPQSGISNGKSFYIRDFYIPKPYKICLEIDGGYHLNNKKYDDERDNFMYKNRIRVLRISNENVNKMKKEDLLKKINDVILIPLAPKK